MNSSLDSLSSSSLGLDSLALVIDSLMTSSAQESLLNGFGLVSLAMLALLGVLVAIHLVNRGAGR
jgi:hypothetical protein